MTTPQMNGLARTAGRWFGPRAYMRMQHELIDAWLLWLSPWAESLERLTTGVFVDAGLPVRADVLRVTDRLAQVELALEELEAKLDAVLAAGRDH